MLSTKDLFSISGTGVIAFVSNPDFESPADSNQDNIYNLNIEASDGTDSVIQAVTVEVSNIEKPKTNGESNPIKQVKKIFARFVVLALVAVVVYSCGKKSDSIIIT